MCKVLNKKTMKVEDAVNSVYIGRGSKWGNPFRIGVDGSRDIVISKYIEYLYDNDRLISDIYQLKGKNLICYCSPLACHGDVLIKLANRGKDENRNIY